MKEFLRLCVIEALLGFAVSVVCLELVSCTKSGSDPVVGERGRVGVTFAVEGARTKAQSGPDASVNTLDVLLFRSRSGVLECSGRTASDSIRISVPSGIPLDYYLIANSP